MSVHHLFDEISSRLKLKNDAAIARYLGFAAPIISKLRNGHVQPSDALILRVHEKAPQHFPVAYIRQLLAFSEEKDVRAEAA